MKISFAEPKLPTSGLLVFLVGADARLGASAKVVDKATKGALTRALKAASFAGKKGESLSVLAPQGREKATILLIGAGNAKDVDALLGLGVLYQNTGQLTKAREMYEAILAIRPERDIKMSVWTHLSPEPVIDIASVNLALLESGGVPGSMTKGAAGEAAVKPAGLTPPPATTPAGSALAGRMAPAQTGQIISHRRSRITH